MVATARRAPSPDKPQGTLGAIWSWERPVHPFASSHYSREAAVEVGHQMDAEVADVVACAIDQGGFSTPHELSPHKIHPRRCNDPSVMLEPALAVENSY
jgi:hypothetical protein